MSRKVLVVDDEKLIVKGIRFNLEQDGMEVDCAYDGEEAVEKAKEKHYDIILLDLMLPKMDGLEVCQQIREFSNVPIVMLTAKGEDMDKINQTSEDLKNTFYAAYENVMKQAQAAGAQPTDGAAPNDNAASQDGVYDAEYKDVDDNNQK